MPEVNPGTTGLVAWWALDETSGQRNDSHGTNHLTDNNTVLYAAGKVGNAASFVGANSEYLNVADNANLSCAGAFALALWLYPTGSGNQGIVSKRGTEYDFSIVFTTSLRLTTSGQAHQISGLTANVWNFVYAGYDGTNAQLSINGAAPTTAAKAAPTDGVNDLWFGRGDFGYLTGLVDEAAFWNGRSLTNDEISWLYNSGNGRSYADLTGGAAVYGLPVIAWHHHQVFGG